MRQDHRFRKKKGLSDDQKRILSMALIPLIVIVLIIVIVIADHAKEKAASSEPTMTETAGISEALDGSEIPAGGDENEENQENMGTGTDGAGQEESLNASQESTQAEPSDGDEGDDFETERFRKDSVPEILDLMKTYFQARVQADAETMNKLYGIEGVSAEALEAQKTKMRSNAKYVNDFQNITTYVMNGTTSNSWLVYTLADIKFYTAKTAAPMIMWCYVQKNEEGTYQIFDNSQLSSNVLLFIENANHSQEVRSLAADVNSRLKKALSEDTDLNSIYGVIRDGSPVWQEDESEAAVVVLDGADQTEGDTDTNTETNTETNTSTSPEDTVTADNNISIENGEDSSSSEGESGTVENSSSTGANGTEGENGVS